MYKGSESRLLVRLSKEELEDFCLSLDRLGKKDRETRAFLHEVLDRAGKEYGFMRQKGQALRIDVLPNVSGGCFLIFTQENASKESSHARKKTIQWLIAFQNTDAFLDCLQASQKTASSKTIHTISWYRRAQKFYALIPIEGAELLPIFSEFGKVQTLSLEESACFKETAEVLSVLSE